MNIAIFASGSGSNAENIISYFSNKKEVQFPIILTNKKDAYIIERAKKMEIPCISFTKQELNETSRILDLLHQYEIDFIVLAGFLLKVPQNLIEAFPNKIINIHPALLPKYGGKGMFGSYVHEAVINAGEKESGITIHYVNELYDEGQIIFQTTCEILKTDTKETLAEKIHELEYKFFPIVIERLITGD